MVQPIFLIKWLKTCVKNEILSFLTLEEVAKIKKPELREIFNKLHNKKISNKKYLFQIEPFLINPQTLKHSDLSKEKQLLQQYFGDEFLQINTIRTSFKLF